MRVHVVHETTYSYELPARGLIQLLRLTPRDHDGQHILRWRIEPSSDGRLRPGEDSLGNLMHTYSCEGPLNELSIRVIGEVETVETHGIVLGTVERLPDLFYLRELSLAAADGAIRSFAKDVMGDWGIDPLASLHKLLEALHNEVIFDTEPTHSATTAAEAFALRRGVCQDLSHIFIAACRGCGIPARYVSGYFHRADGVTDQDAGHAWAEAKVPDLGWVGFDPSNGISVSEAHVRIATGFDYHGAAPIRGSRYGGGSERLEVQLKVKSAQEQAQN